MGNITQEPKAKRLEDYPIIRCAPGEKILCVQRHHPIMLIIPMTLSVISLFLILSLLVFLSYFLPGILTSYLLNAASFASIVFILICTLFSIEIFMFLNWYYQFYIVTNKAIVERHAFRIGGLYSEAVMLDQIHQQELLRKSQNIIFDFLKIQDVYVYFNKLEREEPFIFETPQDAQEIEDLLQNVTIQSGARESYIR